MDHALALVQTWEYPIQINYLVIATVILTKCQRPQKGCMRLPKRKKGNMNSKIMRCLLYQSSDHKFTFNAHISK